MIEVEKRTDFLFPKRGFWSGVSSVIGICAGEDKFNSSKSGEEADYKALKSDWEMVGEDIKKSMCEIINE